ncbi:hypothetical protein [Dickeya lacustris]|uniref:Uncharacterized protein n=1 Tax=Dickeya lacustris TaxID=2259638 RepID=A0ABY8G6U7_9GAMM|nr:hypothetical protein [Dickeya lacustris]WFN55658.1 hypothetical protein O1Q98_19130 [Dickeya lacustris]
MSIDIEANSKSENNGPGICFLLLLILGGVVFFIPESIVFALPVVIGSSFLYFIWYLISQRYLGNILGSMIISVILMGIAAAIPVIGWILLLIWILYNIAKTFESIKTLLPDALYSTVLYGCLLFPAIQNIAMTKTYTIACGVVYVITAVLYCSRLTQQAANTKQSIFYFSIMWLSVPFIALMFISIVASLRAAFRTVLTPVQTVVKTPQNVSAHMRGGVHVNAYTRTVTTIQHSVTSQTMPGIGVVGASMVGSVSETSTPTPKQALPLPVNTPDEGELAHYVTNKDHSFYRYDGLNPKKISNFIQAVNRRQSLPPLAEEAVLFYYDETVFGQGDHGLVLTDEGVYCVLGKLYETFYARFNDVSKVAISGSFNKKIILHMKNGRKNTIELTQSNAGAKKIYALLSIAVQQ